ncbi:glycosyltransferase family 2 protein [Romboutsia sp.]|uniref:glycosyltransferase family 2 protein n=1 Tax=Romboutsia sp. TaxID=1965302 RepID=UPI003F2E4DA1
MTNLKEEKNLKRILVGSPIHQSNEILKEFLISLIELNQDDFEVDYYFVDDNSDKDSSTLLNEFKESQDNVYIISSDEDLEYICDDFTHRWSEDLVKKVTRFKNKMISFAREKEYDYLFLIDSDIVLHPKTLKQLVSNNKDIISNIFWTQWNPGVMELPQVWLKDAYTLYNAKSNQTITTGEVERQTKEFIEQLRKPGVYKVGGLGACTLISKNALSKDISFNEVYNISFWGEDRHFCVRAVALGLELYVDTHYPAYHIYRSKDLLGVEDYKKSFSKRDTEILGSKLLDLIVEGVNSVGTYSFLEELSNNFMKYFTFKEGSRHANSRSKERKKVLSNKIINKTNVSQCTMTFYNENTKVIASLKLVVNGYKNFITYYEEYQAKCVLSLHPNGEFLIDEFNIENGVLLDFIPLVRKVRETPKITLSMLVKNEEGRYLRKVLESAREYIDEAVIIDDGSTDNTVAMCREVLKGIPLKLVENKESKFKNEIDVRKQQWFETISTNPDWIVFLDADEIFENKFKDEVREIVKNMDADGYLFRLYDFWDEDHFRDDKLWSAHYTYRPFMIRYQRNFNYKFQETAQHCGRMPANVTELNCQLSNLRLKHYGWAKEEDRIQKYNRYMELDPNGIYGSLPQYQSILDKQVTLSKWNERE